MLTKHYSQSHTNPSKIPGPKLSNPQAGQSVEQNLEILQLSGKIVAFCGHVIDQNPKIPLLWLL